MLSPLRSLGERPSAAHLLAALRRVYLLGLAALLIPGLLIGLPYALLGSAAWSGGVLTALGVTALLCAGLALGLATRTARQVTPGTPEGRALSIQAAIQAASAPGVPLLMACTALTQPLALLTLLLLAAVVGVAGWLTLPQWSQRASG
ncbi:hypothetical protein [Deinococcus sonorensis]|uniref:MFS transporter n=2 Tax=Deinococcus sonorensis TaxID=309891 RepID=A0AAU7UF89_9DEIO